MILLSDGSVHLDEGDVVPVFCPCGAVYQPELNSNFSVCPKCDQCNNHFDELLVAEVEKRILHHVH